MQDSEIPQEFRSFENGEPFRNCKICNRDLMDKNSHYVIEKAIRKYTGYEAWDVVFEYAICMPCAESFRKELSRESVQSIENYFLKNADFAGHASRLEKLKEERAEVNLFTDHCLVKGLNKGEVEEYQIFGECRGDRFIYGNMPYMISGPAMDDIAELLSEKTIDELDDFAGKYLGPSPELEGLFKGKKLILI